MEFLEDYLTSSADRDSVLTDLDSLWRLPIFDKVSAEGCLPELERNLSLEEQILQETSCLTAARFAAVDAKVLRDEGTETPPISSDSESSEFPSLKGPTPYLKRATPNYPLRVPLIPKEELSAIGEKLSSSKVIVPLKDPSVLPERHRMTSMSPFRRVRLSEEEKSLLIQEGLPTPTRYPLSVMDEKNLKSIRRKLKNKISAQESRRKKKEYMETLEDQIKALENENVSLKDRLSVYSKTNQLLFSEVKKMRALIGKRKTVN